jgi:molybdopterin synthase sulfur carrier subunit|tara:strand:- start:1605 stop:1889 length:285 start_codon:yes stop_codon:yes gene_type:complete
MAVILKVPTALRRVTNGAETLDIPIGTVNNAISILEEKYPGFKDRILDEASGDIHPFISIFLNENDIQYIDGLETAMLEGDELIIIPAIAGGNS